MLTSTLTVPEGYDTQTHPKGASGDAGGGDAFPCLTDTTRDPRRAIPGEQAPVQVVLHEGAGEAVISFVGGQRKNRGRITPEAEDYAPPETPSPENIDRAARRARASARRYAQRNRLVVMWVLTFAGEGLHGPEGRAEAMRAVADYVRRMRATYGDVAYLYSPELHPGGHGWHINLLLPAGYREKHEMERLWGQGFVHFTDYRQDLKGGKRASLRGARQAARYATKYVGKDWGDLLPRGAHRYEVGQGHRVTTVGGTFRSVAEARSWLRSRLGAPAKVWTTDALGQPGLPYCELIFWEDDEGRPSRSGGRSAEAVT